ncbi:hypothetical protein ACFE04_014928 [Oxalis oulophora]
MGTTSNLELPRKSLKINTNDKYSSRRSVSREVTEFVTDQEDYHGGASAAVSVPFSWESQPGTPKARYSERPIPPLTPPPSYVSSDNKTVTKNSKQGLLNSIFPSRETRRRASFPPSPHHHHVLSNSSSSSFSSCRSSSSPWPTTYSVPSSPNIKKSNIRTKNNYNINNKVSSTLSSLFDSRADDDEETDYVPASPLCFGRRGKINLRATRCYSSLIKVFVS